MTTYADLHRIDADLARAGHHPLTDWWREQMLRFYDHSTARTFVGQVGRGGAKSHTSTKVGLCETLCGDWAIPPGERHYWAYVSRTKDEASQRLLLIQSFLRALSIPFDAAGDEIALRDMPRGFRVFACQIGAVSGFRCFGYSSDELAKWQFGPDGASPAGEVCTSLSAMCVTHPAARRLLISSPFSVVDFHYDQYARGNTADQVIANAASWVANPSITEEQTHRIETDLAVWSREYAAIPSAAAGLAFGDPETVERIFGSLPDGYLRGDSICGIDASDVLEGGDGFGYCIGFWAQPDRTPRTKWACIPGTTIQAYPMRDESGYPITEPIHDRPIFRVCETGEFAQAKGVTQERIVAEIARRAKHWGARIVTGDQYASVGGYFAQHGIRFVRIPWSAPSKEGAVSTLRRMIREGTLSVIAHDGLRKEMLSLRFRITRGGHIEYRTGGMDTVASLIAIAHYMNDPDAANLNDYDARPLAGTPYRAHSSGKHEINPGDQ